MRRIALYIATLGVLLVLAMGPSAGCRLTNSSMEPEEVAAAVASDIDEASIREHLKHLTGVSPVQLEGENVTISERGSEKGRRAAAEYMKKSFEVAGVPARILEFASGADSGYNVEAILEGTEGKKHLWVTAHMDSVGNAGANDNASGLVMLLLTAEALARLELKHTVHFVAYDLEEVGLVGSNRYVYTEVISVRDKHGEEAVVGNINSDMIGYEEDEFDAVISKCEPTGPLDDALKSASKAIGPDVALDEKCTDRLRMDSDHAVFLDAGFPAIIVSDSTVFDGYPCYHKPCDTLDKVNVSYLRSVIRMVATASALLAVAEAGQAAS